MILYTELVTNVLFVVLLGYYLITNLQWYDYKLERVVFKHHKYQWHIIYFILPIVLMYVLPFYYFLVYFYLLYSPMLFLWQKKLDKSLVFTKRVKIYLSLLVFITIFIDILCYFYQDCSYGVIIPILLTLMVSNFIAYISFVSYKHEARQKLESLKELKIILITASYGKTSIKNYLEQVLSTKYNVYKTPKSVNTIKGIIQDVNNNLASKHDIYIAEAGAREVGDIEEITMFLKPQYCIIGNVGEQHIEYFKTLDNIINTKMEILKSPKLIKGFVHNSVPINKYDTIVKFPDELNVTKNTLDGIEFDVKINGEKCELQSNILGSFSSSNICAVVLACLEFDFTIDEIVRCVKDIKSVEHRLQMIKSNGKTILDDSYNGNLEGMLEAINVSKTHDGRKVIITPGLVEATKKQNETLISAIDDVFDLVIVTSTLNRELFVKNIKNTKLVVLHDKDKMQEILIEHTKIGDLILFSNDAPNFI